MGMGNGERGAGNGESLKWGIFKSGSIFKYLEQKDTVC